VCSCTTGSCDAHLQPTNGNRAIEEVETTAMIHMLFQQPAQRLWIYVQVPVILQSLVCSCRMPATMGPITGCKPANTGKASSIVRTW